MSTARKAGGTTKDTTLLIFNTNSQTQANSLFDTTKMDDSIDPSANQFPRVVSVTTQPKIDIQNRQKNLKTLKDKLEEHANLPKEAVPTKPVVTTKDNALSILYKFQ